MSLTLTWLENTTAPVNLAPLLPERLAGKSAAALARMRIEVGAGHMTVKRLFDIAGSPGDTLTIANATANLNRVGAGMGSGSLIVDGSVGAELARGMRGGTITVSGSAGDYACAGMNGGTVSVRGSVGDRAGAAYPGEQLGMAGGVLHVRRNAGQRLGDRMRRGLIIVEGSAGDYCGSRMVAGTVIVCGDMGDQCGISMRRGTVIASASAVKPPASFVACGEFSELNFLPLLERHVSSVSRKAGRALREASSVQRHAGDSAHGGLGELLLLTV